MERLPTRSRHSLGALLLGSALLLFMAACDTADPLPAEEVVIEGTVTASAEHEQPPGSADRVEGATVTAATVGAGGQLQTLEGQAVTDAEGRFTLTTTTSAEPILIEAETADGFRGATLIEAGGASASGTITAPPMSVQATAAADAFVAARGHYPGVTAADATLHLDASTAAALDTGDLQLTPVAASIAAAARAESAFALHADGGGATQPLVDQALARRHGAYAQLRAQLATATTVAQRRAALEAFFDAYGEAYAEAGMSALHAGHAATAASAAGVRFATDATAAQRFAMTHSGRKTAAMAVARAVEAEFETDGATTATLEALADARVNYLAALRAATTSAQVAEAAADYRAAVRTQLAAHADVSPAAIDAAFDATAQARATLDAAVAGAAVASAVAQAHTAFYTSAHASAHTALGMEGDLGANVVTAIAAL